MAYENILLETSDHIATITLNRPEKLNALIPALLEEFTQALEAINDDHDINVLIVTGAGRAFSSGFDIAPGRHRPAAPVTANWDATHLAPRSVMKLWNMRQPTITAIKDSTELIKDLDPEAAQQLLDPPLHLMMSWSSIKCSAHWCARGLNNDTVSPVTGSVATVWTCLYKFHERQHRARLSNVVRPPLASGIM
jgi:enoyl-CoA hydratase/isomerase-like protein